MPHGRDPTQTGLFDWLRAQGARFPGAEVRDYPGMGSGLAAPRALETEEEILLVPRTSWFTRKTAHTPYGAVLDDMQNANVFSHSMSRLALLLALERANPTSFFAPYAAALHAPTVPYELTDAERAACEGLPLLTWIDEQRDLTHDEAARIREALPADLRNAVDVARWQWAYGHVMQRTFSVDLDEEEVWVLVPGMDLCNHDTTPNTRYFAEEEGWLLEAARPIEAGEQLTIQYGRSKTSTDLFLYYGFVPGSSPHDRVRVRLALADDDPDRAAREEATQVLGLDAQALIGADGELPSAFLHTAILWALDAEAFHATQPEVTGPAFAAAALRRVADALDGRGDAMSAPDADDAAQAQDGWLPAIAAYRRNVRSLLHDAARSLRARAEAVASAGWDPGNVVPTDDEGRYAMLDVVVPA